MSRFRYTLLALTVATLALVLGVVLGASVTSGRLIEGMTAARDGQAGQVAALRGQIAARDAHLDATERLVAANAPAAVRGTLAGRTVAVVTAADADPGDVAAVTDLLGRSGAQVTGRLELTDALLAPERADSIRALVPRLAPSGTRLPTTTEPGALTGTMLASVITIHGRATPESEAVTALTGLADAGLIRPVPAVAPTPAQLVLVVAGPTVDPGRGTTLARLAGALDRGSLGAVVVGREGSSTVTAARNDPRLSTVADVGRPSGRLAGVLALHDQATGSSNPGAS